MMLPRLEEKICSTGRHCEDCRNEVGGKRFRENLTLGVTLPADWPACPQGKPWGWIAPARNEAANDPARLRVINDPTAVAEICSSCPSSMNRGFGRGQDNAPVSSYCAEAKCCAGEWGEVSLRYGKCPKGHWPTAASTAIDAGSKRD
jgi:hypothetical protein